MRAKLKWGTHADLAIERTPNVGREEYLAFMTFQRNDRPLFGELFGPMVGLKEEWEEQGATSAELSFSAFRHDQEARGMVAVNTGRLGGLPEVLLEDTETHRIWKDPLGRTLKLMKGYATLPLPLDYPVRTMEDWLRIKPQYQFSEERLSGDWEGMARADRARDRVICAGIPGGFDEPRELMGDEELCVAFHLQPELVDDMLTTMGDTAFRVLERVTRKITVDVLVVHEDLAGKGGPLVGPSQVRRFIAPYYRRVWDLLSARGARLFEQDSDGDVRQVIEPFLEAGVNSMHPLEPAAGMDIVELRARYGRRLAFAGGLDKHVLRRGQAAIDAELERKIPPMVASGACFLSLDHRIPNGSPLAAYRSYVAKAWEIIERSRNA